MDEYIRRRVEFLLAEAKLNAKRDQAITFVMRVLSNHATVGKDASSSAIKRLNPRVSKEACKELERVNTFKEWTTNTINEHPMPLKATWFWLNEKSETLSTEDVWGHFVQNPMFTILRAEDADLNSNGLRASGDKSRYSKVGIEKVILDVSPIEYFKRLS
jgi:hypothetical protein